MQLVRLSPTAQPPARAHATDAGFDLVADETVLLAPGEHAAVGTGIALSLPPGTFGMVCPRSGLAAKNGVTVLNSPGIVDAGYRGEVKVILVNHSAAAFEVRPGDRIAQLVIAAYIAPDLVEVDGLDESDRGEAGFGSTGV